MDLQGCAALVPEINERAARLREVSDGELTQAAAALRAGDLVVAEAFAVVVEASHRTSGEHLRVDRLAATVAQHFGLPAKGDAVLAAAVDAMAGSSVHVVSSTDELARRDADRARSVGRLLGLEVGLVVADMDIAGRQAAYQADITCARAEELGYDYLRDNLSWATGDVVQRGFDCAFVTDVANDLIEYLVTAERDGVKLTLARITAYGLFRRYRKLAGVDEPSGNPMAFECEDVRDTQCRDFYDRRQRILTSDDFPEFGRLLGDRAYERRCQQVIEQTGLGPESVPVLQRTVLLSCFDRLWRDHLVELRQLHERSLSRRNHVAKFRRHATTRYRAMWDDITRNAVDMFLTVDVAPT